MTRNGLRSRVRSLGITALPILALFVAAAVWLALVVLSPVMVPPGTLTDLSGSVGVRDNDDQFAVLDPLPHAVYWIGDGQCHQLASRSFFINDNQMPFCARDLGLFIGLAAGFGFVMFRRYKIHPALVILGIVPLGVDGVVQLVTDYESNNPLRLATGIVAGLVLALMLAHFLFVIQEDRDKAGKGRSDGPPGPGHGQP